MQARLTGIVVLIVFAILAIPARAPETRASEELGSEYVVVQYDAGATAQALRADGSALSLEEQGFRQVPVPAGKSKAEFLSELRAQPGVLSAQSDAKVYAAAAPDDPLYATSQAAYLAQLGVPAAWDLVTGTGRVVVALIDSGLDLGHEDFAGRLWENTADAFSDGLDHDGNGCVNDRYGCRFVSLTTANRDFCGYTSSLPTGNVIDDNGRPGANNHSHGTMVAGVIGAAGNNAKGIAGVAWNVKLMTIKVLDCGSGVGATPSGEMSDVARAIDYARLMGANVINISVASKANSPDGDLEIVRRAIQAAQDQGVIIVAAAGNHAGNDPVGVGYPGAYTQFPNLVTVGAANNLAGYSWASYSNYGPAIDFAAPGESIASTNRSDLGLTNLYSAGTGTSFAAPIVSGMFALMLSRNPSAPAADLIQIARDTATPAAPAPHGQNWAGSGTVNIGAAVQRIPMYVTGSPLHDWRDVPPGTDVRAMVDGVECGRTTSTASAIVTRYLLRVKSAAEQPGCGAPGKVVQITIAGRLAVPTLPWGGLNESLALVNRDVSSVSPPPGPIVVQTLGGSWANVAHLDPSGTPPGAVSYLPGAWTSLLSWDPTAGDVAAPLAGRGAYRRFSKGVPAYANSLATVETYGAYWVEAPAASLASLNPNPPPGRTLSFQPGWNNFVYTGSSKQVEDALSEIGGKYSQVLLYENTSHGWLSYVPGQHRSLNDFGGLFKLKVYWVFMTQSGSITMN